MNAVTSTPPLQEWLGRVANGDKSALRLLYDHFSPKVMGIAYSLLSRRDEAEEVVQETFTLLWRTASTFDEHRGSVSAWIATIARNRAVDRLRARRDTQSLTDVIHQVVDGSPTPPELASASEDVVRVRRAVEKLPDDQRSVVLLTYFHGLSQTEIAAHTGEPLGTVKTRIRLAMQKLDGMLRAEVAP